MGDVKLAAVMGLYLGKAVAPALLIGFAAGALYGLALIARHGAAARKQAVPFGPVPGARRRGRRLLSATRSSTGTSIRSSAVDPTAMH